MKKIQIIILLIGCIVMSLSACSNDSNSSQAQAEDVHHIKISHLSNESDPIHKAFQHFEKSIEEKSDGRIQADIYSSQQISNSDREVAESVQKNIFQVGSAPTYSIAGVSGIEEYLLWDVPYLFENDEEIYEITDGPIGENLGDRLHDKTGLMAYDSYSIGWVKLTNGRNEVTNPDDVQGISARTTVSEYYMEVLRSWGGNPTPMSFGEVFTGLQQGTVDGVMTTTNLIRTSGFHEVQNYLTTVDPFAIVHIPIVNGDFYNSLPSDLQQIFDEVMYEDYLPVAREEHAKAEEESIEELRNEGMQVYELSENEREEFKEQAKYIREQKEDIVSEDLLEEVEKHIN